MLESVLRRVAPMADTITGDAELLRRFAADRDESAFAAIVRRHGPLVWAVCRSLLPHEADAEDAFQATFLALVRSSRTVRTPARLGSWLHGVACRVAMKARRSAARRKQRERTAAAAEADSRVAEADWDQLRLALHAEVCRLAEPLRTAFVLCELQGVSQTDAAQALGWKLGTLSGRLSRARQQLLERLGKNGVPAGVAVAAAVTGGSAIAAAPARAIARALALAKSDLTGLISASVLELARGSTEASMMRTKYLAAAVALTAALTIGTATTLIPVLTAQQPADTRDYQPDARPQSPGQNKMPPTIRDYSAIAASQWEYKFAERPGDVMSFKRVLVEQGSAGWEFCGVEHFGGSPDGAVIVFKRPKAAGRVAVDSGAKWATQTPELGYTPKPGGKAPPDKQGDPLTGSADGKAAPDVYTIRLQYAQADQLAATLKQLFSGRGRVLYDERTNTLLVQGNEDFIKTIRDLVTKIDTPVEPPKGAPK
jgi:RNA polymerase sigma factor (sigma-70 family)